MDDGSFGLTERKLFCHGWTVMVSLMKNDHFERWSFWVMRLHLRVLRL